MQNLIRAVKSPDHHLMQNWPLEVILGFIAVIVGCCLLYDAFDSRGKKMIWPLGGLAPW